MKSAARRRFRPAALRLEALETRCLLAADIAAGEVGHLSHSANLTEAQEELASTVADSINAFNHEFYRRMQEESGNLFYSPLSLAMAFGMLEAAADDQGAQEIADLFRFDSLGEDLHAAIDALMDSLNAARAEAQMHIASSFDSSYAPSPTELRISNALFSQTGSVINPEYLDLLGSAYEALHDEVDFIDDPAAAADRINAWASEATEGRIPEVISEETAEDLFVLLANAVYFKNPWAREFRPEDTNTETFHLFDGQTVDVSMMHQTGHFPYMESEGFRVLELPHAFGRFSTVFLLPDDPRDIAADSLPSDLEGYLEGLTGRKVNVALPKLKMEMSFNLNEVVQDLGVERVFADDSLPHMAPQLRVDFVRQDTFFEMDEAGSEAAAVTTIGIMETVALVPQAAFRADRPFHFLIRDNETGAIMFMGRQMDPTAEGETPVPDIANAPPKPPGIYHNSENPFDVDRSFGVTINDAMVLAMKLRDGGPRVLPVSDMDFNLIQVTHYYDVNNDDMLTLHDAILTVSHLRAQQADSAALAAAAAQLNDSPTDDAEGEMDSSSALDLFMADLGDGLR